MLKGISPLLAPELLATMCRMGPGDELILADAHFPGESFNQNIIRADGLQIPDLLDGILPLFELDQYVDAPVFMMDIVPGDTADPVVEASYKEVLGKHCETVPTIAKVERFAFYEQTRNAFCVVMTGDTHKYGNLIIKKGVTPVA